MSFVNLAKFFLYLVPLSVAVVSTSTIFPFIVGKYVWFRVSVDLALIFLCLAVLFQDQGEVIWQKIKSLFRKPLVIAVSLFSLIFVLAGFFGFDGGLAFWSNFERGEGGLQILHLFLFFILLSLLFDKSENWRTLLWVSLSGALLMVLYGFFAGLEVNGFIGVPFHYANYRLQGSIGNPAYVAAYLIFALGYALLLLFAKPRNTVFTKIISGSFVLIFLIGFWAAATRGAFLGLIAAAVGAALYLAFSQKRFRKILLGIIIVLLLIVSLLVIYKDNELIKQIPGSRLFDISFSTKTFGDRAIMWQSAWEGWRERPVLGWGAENFINVFDRYFNTDYFKPVEGFGAWFDRAHSVVFDYLVETGLLGLLAYLSIFVVFYWQFFKKYHWREEVRNLKKAVVFSLLIAYFVQGLVLFDVLVIYISIFLFLAYSLFEFDSPSQDQKT